MGFARLLSSALFLCACRLTAPMSLSARVPAPRASLPPEEAAWRGALPKQSSLPLLDNGKPDYASIDASPVSKVLTATIRKLLVNEVGEDADPLPWTDFQGLLTSVRQVNDMPGTAADVQARARRVFEGILPSLGLFWVPPVWLKLVKPNTAESVQHYAFVLVFQTLFPWLMGPMEGVEEIEVPTPESLRWLPFVGDTVKLPQAVKAERCRFLETSSCASVCVNSCKVPSQEWLGADFGMEVHIQPNYDDFSCTWRFGVPPPPLEEDEAVMVPCFANCDSAFQGERDAFRQRADKMGGVAMARQFLDAADLATVRARGPGGASKDGSALSDVTLRARQQEVSRNGKCWSVAEERGTAVQGSGEDIPLRWEGAK